MAAFSKFIALSLTLTALNTVHAAATQNYVIAQCPQASLKAVTFVLQMQGDKAVSLSAPNLITEIGQGLTNAVTSVKFVPAGAGAYRVTLRDLGDVRTVSSIIISPNEEDEHGDGSVTTQTLVSLTLSNGENQTLTHCQIVNESLLKNLTLPKANVSLEGAKAKFLFTALSQAGVFTDFSMGGGPGMESMNLNSLSCAHLNALQAHDLGQSRFECTANAIKANADGDVNPAAQDIAVSNQTAAQQIYKTLAESGIKAECGPSGACTLTVSRSSCAKRGPRDAATYDCLLNVQ